MTKTDIADCIYKHIGRSDDLESLIEMAEEVARMAVEEERESSAAELVNQIIAAAENQINNCKNCQYWQTDETRYNRAIDPAYNPATGAEWISDEEKRQFFPDTVRYCKHPKVVFYQRPDSNGSAVFDGSEYDAYLATGQDYGCVNFEPFNAKG